MKHKIGILCLSIIVMSLAVGWSANRSSSIRTYTTTETLKEMKSEEERKGKEENDTSSNEFLSIGDSTIVSKNIIDTNDKISEDKVTITLDNVIRGENAQKEVDNYNSTNPTSKIPKLVNDSLEYVIIEYTTTLPDDIKYTNQGQSSHVGIQICNLDGSTINTSDDNYSLRTMNFEQSQGLQSNDSGTTKTVITLPKNVTEFVVKLGDNSSDTCSYIIK